MITKSFQLNNLYKNSIILALPGFLSIFLSIISIPIHLRFAGTESYGNYLIFHIFLSISFLLNFGIAKTLVVCSNNENKFINKISYDAIKYSLYICIIILFLYFPVKFILNNNLLNFNFSLELFILGLIISIIYLTFEGVMQANKLFKYISLFNFIFYSLSLSVPSILLIFFNDLLLNELICISILIKVFCIILVITYSIFKKLIDKNKRNKILLKYLKKNSQWLTLNSFLVQLYEFLDKYLIKIFLGSSLLAIYSIPQQITGKLSILSKGFSTFLLPNLGNKKSEEFIHSVDFFLRYIPILIFLVVPFYPFIFSIWLGDQYTSTIHDLAKIFSLVAILSGTSHILVTKFEANQISKLNFKIEIILLPIFLIFLFYLCTGSYSLIYISTLILSKELIFIFLRIYFLKLEKKKIRFFYLNLIMFTLLLILSFINMDFYYVTLVLIIFYTYIDVKLYN